MIQEAIIKQLVEHEGEVLKVYTCPAGKPTVGVGRNLLDKGISCAESRYMLLNDIAECVIDLQRIFPDWNWYSDNVQMALTDMRFNLGPRGFRSFRRMIAAIHAKDWTLAAKEALDSRWATQVQPSRVQTITDQLRGG